MASPAIDFDAERAVLGAILVSDRTLEPLVTEERLRPQHFYRADHEAIFAAMLAVMDDQGRVDEITVRDRLDGQVKPEAVAALTADVPQLGAVRQYARRVIDLAARRRWQEAAAALEEAAATGDRDKLAKAERLLAPTVQVKRPEPLADVIYTFLETDDANAIPLPFPRLEKRLSGGLRRGDVTVLGGWTSHGKSVLTDQILQYAADRGFTSHAYINEMSRLDRGLRTVARLTGVPFSNLTAKSLDGYQRGEVLTVLNRLPFEVTDVAGWSAEEIARDIRRNRWDLAAVDLIHLIPHKDEADLRAISQILNAAARQADCHLILVAQLNEERARGDHPPPPVLRDIRGSGMIKNDAANVMFVYRDQEVEEGIARSQSSGMLYLAKARNAELGGQRVRLNAGRMRFDPDDT